MTQKNDLIAYESSNVSITKKNDMYGFIEQLNETENFQVNTRWNSLAYDRESLDSCIIKALNNDTKISENILAFNQAENQLGSIESKEIAKYMFSYLDDLIVKGEL